MAEDLIAIIVAGLEAIAEKGRPGWEELAEAISKSSQADEIQIWLGNIGEGEI